MKNYFQDILNDDDISSSRLESNQLALNTNNLSQYSDGITAAIPPEVATVLVGPAMDIAKEAIKCFTSYQMCKAHEETERGRIAAQLKAIELQINADKDRFINLLNRKFDEREKLYRSAEKAAELASERGDKEMLALIYNYILSIYNQDIVLI